MKSQTMTEEQMQLCILLSKLEADDDGIVDITEVVRLVIPNEDIDEWVPAKKNISYVTRDMSPIIDYMVDTRGFKKFRYKGIIYSSSWDGEFYFKVI